MSFDLFERPQTLLEKRPAAGDATKRRIRGIVCLNERPGGGTLSPTMRKPFDVVAEGRLVPSSRGDRTQIERFLDGVRPHNQRIWAHL